MPLGIDVEHKSKHLYVINHDFKTPLEAIEIFKVNEENEVPKSLDYVFTITNQNLTQEHFGVFNSIYALEDFKFYVTVPAPEVQMRPVSTSPMELRFFKSAIMKKSQVKYCEYDTTSNYL